MPAPRTSRKSACSTRCGTWTRPATSSPTSLPGCRRCTMAASPPTGWCGNPNYHRGAPKFRQFIHKFVPDQLVLYGQMKTGEIDYMGLSGVPVDRFAEARALPDRDLMTVPQPWVQFIYFNCAKPQFKDPKV